MVKQFSISIILLLVLFNVKYCSWNDGFEKGMRMKQDDAIIRGKVECYYKDRYTCRKK